MRHSIKRLLLMGAAVTVMMSFAAAPVIAQDYYQDYVEPPVEGASDYVPPPDLAAQCTPALQFGNTGNFNNAPVLQYASEGEFGEFGVELDPDLAAACEEAVQQSSAASS